MAGEATDRGLGEEFSPPWTSNVDDGWVNFCGKAVQTKTDYRTKRQEGIVEWEERLEFERHHDNGNGDQWWREM
jgi:hypothetical protein